MIEFVCSEISKYLINEDICDSCGDYLKAHAYSALRRIKDADLRNMHVMDGAEE